MATPLPEQRVKDILRINEFQEKALSKLGIFTIQDLLYHFPVRYEYYSSAKFIRDCVPGETVTVYGKIKNLKTGKAFKSHIPKAEGTVEDNTGSIKVIWLHQAYIAKLIQSESLVKVHGKLTERNGVLGMMNPDIEPVSALPQTIGDDLFSGQGGDEDGASGTGSGTGNRFNTPVYEESKGITSKWFFHAVQKIIKNADFARIPDPIPEDIRKAYNLPNLQSALIWIHAPKKDADAQVARKRFAFEEIFYIQLKNEQTRRRHQEEQSFIITGKEDSAGTKNFISKLGFEMTDGQKKSIADILEDFGKGHPMSRLLEGDVGSGKTAVAAVTTYAVVSSRPKDQNFGTLQVAYMAPTEILAKQHFESFIKYFKHMPISIGLITGNGCRKFPSKVNAGGWTDISRAQFLKWTASGEISVVIGTHALIQKAVKFKHLAYVIIDEQHRFGTAQRQKLTKKEAPAPVAKKTIGSPKRTELKNGMPHLLSMTATPIPRTLALTIYGDLDLSLLDEMPSGRKKVITEIVPLTQRDRVYEHIRKELQSGRQAYVICPRINEPDPEKEQALIARSVKEEAKRLKKDVFPEYRIDIMHSQMKAADKDEVMARFAAHEIDILVSTSVVEVGVNVPNSTNIIIEGGERFGLSQLHQLRGRVIRSNHQPYCFVFTETKGKGSEKTADRLKALATAKNGFELSELDLALRGAGELYGGKQWGISDIAMDAIKNLKMVEAARKEAQRLIGEDAKLMRYPLLAETLSKKADVHFE
jgi:ATP-dependent DNA helicase RecG